jgi:transposase-like protein
MVLTMTTTTTCPRCHASEVRHVTGDQYRCQCGRTLRLTWLALPWEQPMPRT